MKYLRQFCAITVLTFTLTASAFAHGEMGGGRCISEPAPREQTMNPPGEMGGGRATREETPNGETAFVDAIQSALLSTMQTLMSIF